MTQSAHKPSATVSVARALNAPAETIFDAWLDEATVAQWLFATPLADMKRAKLDPRPGGSFSISEKRGESLAEHFGTYGEITRPGRLSFDFQTAQDQPPTRVAVSIVPDGTGCIVTVEQSVEPATPELIERSRNGWTKILDALAKHAAS
jgi:uncharacterized protein YndB with AHSA1/START domain